jgi:hypothetical protein
MVFSFTEYIEQWSIRCNSAIAFIRLFLPSLISRIRKTWFDFFGISGLVSCAKTPSIILKQVIAKRN